MLGFSKLRKGLFTLEVRAKMNAAVLNLIFSSTDENLEPILHIVHTVEERLRKSVLSFLQKFVVFIFTSERDSDFQ